jgi:hypothetical protein
MKSGIGGIGNFRKLSEAVPAQPKPHINPRTTGVFLSGIGGVGNGHTHEQRAIASQEQAIARRAIGKENRSTAWHHGIGGVGNQRSSYGSSAVSITSSNCSYSYSITAGKSGADMMKAKIVGLFTAKSKKELSSD